MVGVILQGSAGYLLVHGFSLVVVRILIVEIAADGAADRDCHIITLLSARINLHYFIFIIMYLFRKLQGISDCLHSRALPGNLLRVIGFFAGNDNVGREKGIFYKKRRNTPQRAPCFCAGFNF